MGWLSLLGGLLGPILGQQGAQAAGNQAANAQNQFGQQAEGQAAQDMYNQQARMAQIIQNQFLNQQNPFQVAAQGMHPFFSQPGQDTGIFSSQSPGGMQGTPPPPNPSFVAQNAPQGQGGPSPQGGMPNVAGWGPQYQPPIGRTGIQTT